MFGFKSPSLLIRVSHLILIQIIFIFSALVLMIFYPEDNDSLTMDYRTVQQSVMTGSDHLFKLLGPNPNPLDIRPDLFSKIQYFVEDNEFISDVSLIYTDTAVDTLVYLAASEREHLFADASPETYRSVLSLLNSGNRPYLSTITEDGRNIVHLVRSPSGTGNYALVIASPNPFIGKMPHAQAHLLLLLFLISALISLMIIHLMFQGVKKPLNQLVKGFEKTADGEECQIAEKGDKQIRSLTRAFNEMSLKLSQKRTELAEANHQLLRANKSLVESESILTALVDYSPDAIIVTDLDDQVTIYNQAAARDFGYNQSNMMGKKMSSLIPAVNINWGSTAPDDNSETREVICRRKDGSRFPAVLVHTALGPEGSRPMAILYFVKSISESENYQEMIVKLDRIASRGKMARDIAHEINNYLAVLQGNLELMPLILAKNEPEKLEQKIQVMKETVGKISNFTEGLTRFSDEDSEFTKEDLNQLVENLVAFLKPQNKFDNIFLCTNLSESLPLVEVDAGQMQHLLVHLIRNAAEAMADLKESKWIVVSTSYDEASGSVSIKVADGGPGVIAENISKLFVKRFSTRRGGTGLGLLTCKNIVDNHNGDISFSSTTDSRSVFEVRIPVARTSDEKSQKESSKDSGRQVPINK
jgi:PAS domain S-box-containing protein